MVRQILPADRHPDVIFILTDPDIHEIAAVIIFRHPNSIPFNCNLISIPYSPDLFWRCIESICDPQAYRLYCDGFDITCDVNHIRGDPAVVAQAIEFHI